MEYMCIEPNRSSPVSGDRDEQRESIVLTFCVCFVDQRGGLHLNETRSAWDQLIPIIQTQGLRERERDAIISTYVPRCGDEGHC